MTPIIWLLGLSGSGKTTLGSLLRLFLENQGYDVAFVDADAFRQMHGFHGFERADRLRNIDAMRDFVLEKHAEGNVCVVSAITPYACMRQMNRETLPLYREVWVRCGLQTLLARDTKGLYSLAERGALNHLSGISDDFDQPTRADLVLDTDRLDLGDCYEQLRNLTLAALHEGEKWEGYLNSLKMAHTSLAQPLSFSA